VLTGAPPASTASQANGAGVPAVISLGDGPTGTIAVGGPAALIAGVPGRATVDTLAAPWVGAFTKPAKTSTNTPSQSQHPRRAAELGRTGGNRTPPPPDGEPTRESSRSA